MWKRKPDEMKTHRMEHRKEALDENERSINESVRELIHGIQELRQMTRDTNGNTH